MLRAVLVACVLAAAAPAYADGWNTPESRARWHELSTSIFGPRSTLEAADGRVTLDAPPTAQDAALVPVTIGIAPGVHADRLDLVIDENPSPLAAKVAFGPDGDPRKLSLRVRVNSFTNMHAVATTADGHHLVAVAFVQGAGGCSAPMGSGAEAASHMGEMRMKFGADAALAGAPQATLMIRHPNFNGMQTDPATHGFIPARYIKTIAVRQGDTSVFTLQTDISLSTNPVITFLYRRDGGKPFTVDVVDSANATWSQRFDAAPTTN